MREYKYIWVNTKSPLLSAFTSLKIYFAPNINYISMVLTQHDWQNFDKKQNSFVGCKPKILFFFREFSAECKSILLFLAVNIIFSVILNFCVLYLSKLSIEIAICSCSERKIQSYYLFTYCNFKNFDFS